LLKRRRNGNVCVLERAFSGHFEWFGKLENQIGPYIPAIAERDRRGLLVRAPLRRTAVGPRDESLDLGISKTLFVSEMAETGVGEPRRHFACGDGDLDGFGPRTRRFVCEK